MLGNFGHQSLQGRRYWLSLGVLELEMASATRDQDSSLAFASDLFAVHR